MLRFSCGFVKKSKNDVKKELDTIKDVQISDNRKFICSMEDYRAMLRSLNCDMQYNAKTAEDLEAVLLCKKKEKNS